MTNPDQAEPQPAYGEPWEDKTTRRPGFEYLRIDDRDGNCVIGLASRVPGERAMACVNALAGKDPARLADLLEKAESMRIENAVGVNIHATGSFDEFIAALDAFRTPGREGGS